MIAFFFLSLLFKQMGFFPCHFLITYYETSTEYLTFTISNLFNSHFNSMKWV